MAAARNNFSAEEGATFRTSFTITIAESGLPWDLTGFSARMQVRRNYSSTDTLLNLSSDNGITLGDAAGTIDIEVLNLQVSQGSYVYDFELESAGGEIWRVLTGRFSVAPNVTK